MRIRITLPEMIVRELDRRGGSHGRSAFIAGAVERADFPNEEIEVEHGPVGA
jgi:metal-responsive CopG/Arc/MetJ family transcriptional regulator